MRMRSGVLVTSLLAALAIGPAIAQAAPVVDVNVAGWAETPVAAPVYPSDSTGAIGPNGYVQLTNQYVSFYSRTGAKGESALLSLLVDPNDQVDTVRPTDPQIIWDPTTSRFYYTAGGWVTSAGTQTYQLFWGFSETSHPTSFDQFCSYEISYGSTLTDFPRLGDTRGYLLVAIHQVGGGATSAYQLRWIPKPPAGSISSCPTQPATGTIPLPGDQYHYLPQPVPQVDPSPTGWMISAGGNGSLDVWRVTSNPTTHRPTVLKDEPLSVPTYAVPYTDAPQPGTLPDGTTPAPPLNPGAGSQAVSAIDPTIGRTAIWTTFTSQNAANQLQVNWYEIDPTSGASPPRSRLVQSGVIAKPGEWYYDPAISPDRVVRGSTKAYGSAMVLVYTHSSATLLPQIEVVSKRHGKPISAPAVVASSTDPILDLFCIDGTASACRYGDYPGASPDPAAATGQTGGRVWITSEWGFWANDPTIDPLWDTQVAEITP